MEGVVQRLPTVQLMPAPSEDTMINELENWRASLGSGFRGDSCINGYGILSIGRLSRIICVMIL